MEKSEDETVTVLANGCRLDFLPNNAQRNNINPSHRCALRVNEHRYFNAMIWDCDSSNIVNFIKSVRLMYSDQGE